MNQAKIVASATNVPCGRKNAAIPAAMKSTPRIPWTHFQPADDIGIAMNSFTPAKMATIPNMIEMA